jgi:hypothetical protein
MNAIAILLSITLFGIGSCVPTGWNGIVPLHSTREEVERFLGPPVRPCTKGCSYDTKNEGVFVLYSGKPCESGEQSRWRVPPDTVLGLSVYPAVKPQLSHLKLNLKSFAKTRDPELQGYLTYTDAQEGVTYEVSDKGLVLGIEFFPSSKDESLRCPAAPQPK